jgi:hypothetical protein
MNGSMGKHTRYIHDKFRVFLISFLLFDFPDHMGHGYDTSAWKSIFVWLVESIPFHHL